MSIDRAFNLLLAVATIFGSFGAAFAVTEGRHAAPLVVASLVCIALAILVAIGGSIAKRRTHRWGIRFHLPITLLDKRLTRDRNDQWSSDLDIRIPGYSFSNGFQQGNDVWILGPMTIVNHSGHDLALGAALNVGLRDGSWIQVTVLPADHPICAANGGSDPFLSMPIRIKKGDAATGRMAFRVGANTVQMHNSEGGTTGDGYRNGITILVLTDQMTQQQAVVVPGSAYPDSRYSS